MPPAEVISLLSSDNEAALQTSNIGKGGTITNGGATFDFELLSDDFDTRIAEGPSKRAKLSLSLSSEDGIITSPRLPLISKRRISPKATVGGRPQAAKQWLPIDGSDPIVFTSSLGVATAISRRTEKTLNPIISNDEDSDDSLPEDLLSAPIRKSNAATALSGRTAALLESLSQPHPREKPPNGRNRSSNKPISRGKTLSQVSASREHSTGPGDNNGRAAQGLKWSKRSRLTEEEKAARGHEQEKAKAVKIREKKNSKATSKEQKAKEKEEEQERKRIHKAEKAKEKRIAADLAEVNKSKLDKKDSTPEMIVDLPASIDGQSVDTQIKEFHKNLGVDTALYQSPIPNVIRWRRKMRARWVPKLDHWEPIERMEIHDEKHVMCLMSARDFVALAMVQNNDEDVETHVTKLKNAYEGCTPIYMIEGLHIWMRKNRTAENRAYQERVNSLSQSNGDGAALSSQRALKRKMPVAEFVDEDMIEDALLRLQVKNGCLVHHTNTSAETAEWVANFTQHISTIPYRTPRMNLETSFCMESGQVKTGDDKNDTFVKMLQEVVRVTPPIAYGIATEYPNVLSLVKGFQKHGPLILEDLQKSANRNGALTDRKVGPAISRRLYKVFMVSDPASTDV